MMVLVLALGTAPPGSAQRVVTDDEWCETDRGDAGPERHCEVREFDLSARGQVRVDAAPNGGIRIEAWERGEILLRAKVQAWSRRGDPRELARDIRIETSGRIAAQGPDPGRREGWSVSYRLMVPRDTDLDLETTNGGIRIDGVRGTLSLETGNGGITLNDVGGNVKGRTTNGGLDVTLSGERWDGEALDVRTTNGGVTLTLPEGYRADLETGTVNGSLHTDFPVTVRGRLRSSRILTELNGGGPPIHVSTVNGGIRIRAR
jgi:hypothetical protein